MWPGNKHDSETYQEQIDFIREEFGVEHAIWGFDEGMYSEGNLEEITEKGFDYILSLEWHRQREKLLELAPEQLELFDERGYYGYTYCVTFQGGEVKLCSRCFRYLC